MSQATEQNVRTREEIETELQRFFTHGVRGPNAAWQVVHHIFDEVRAYGAAEQRRKDAERPEPRTCNHCGGIGEEPGAYYIDGSPYSCSVCDGQGVIYMRSPNVAALEARIAELEKELDQYREGYLGMEALRKFYATDERHLKVVSLARDALASGGASS